MSNQAQGCKQQGKQTCSSSWQTSAMFVDGTAVLVTVAYLAIQVRTARIAVQRQNARQLVAENNRVIHAMVLDPALVAIHVKAVGGAELDDVEAVRWHAGFIIGLHFFRKSAPIRPVSILSRLLEKPCYNSYPHVAPIPRSNTEIHMARVHHIITGLVCLASAQSFAVPPLLASQFTRDCASGEVQDAAPERCALYISGFLDGAVATDARVAENVADEFERKETITERAIRTRVGERMRRYGPSVYAEYCIGEPVPVAEVIELLRREIPKSPPDDDDLARDTMYALLRKHYPCRE